MVFHTDDAYRDANRAKNQDPDEFQPIILNL